MTHPDLNRFCTGPHSTVPAPASDPYKSKLNPDGQLGYEVRTRLREGQDPTDIAESMDVSVEQVLAMWPHVDSLPSFRRKAAQ